MLGASLVNPYGGHLIAHALWLSDSDFIRQGIVEWMPSFDPRFRELWCGYRKTGSWMRVFDAYERDPELAARCASGQDTEEDG